ncbi:protein of unknown function [Streptomyces murinus]
MERPGCWRRGMHQQPGYWNGNKRSAVRKFRLRHSAIDFPPISVSEPGVVTGVTHRKPGVMTDRPVSHDTDAGAVS